MSTRKTVDLHTPHGEVEYEVVTCANCEAEVVPREAVLVGVGFEEVSCDGLPICRATHERPIETRALCGYCAEQVLDYEAEPAGGVRRRLAEFANESSATSVGLWLGTVLATTFVVALVVGSILFRLFGLA